jgi:hypothetical protein
LFMVGFGWEKTVAYQIHNSLEALPEELFGKLLSHIANYAQHKPKTSLLNRALQLLN